jgi:hypothetical protein
VAWQAVSRWPSAASRVEWSACRQDAAVSRARAAAKFQAICSHVAEIRRGHPPEPLATVEWFPHPLGREKLTCTAVDIRRAGSLCFAKAALEGNVYKRLT